MVGAKAAFLNHEVEPHIDDNGELGEKETDSLVIMKLQHQTWPACIYLRGN